MRLGFNEKLETLRRLDEEIVGLLDDDAAVLAEIDQADQVKDNIYDALIKIDRLDIGGRTTTPTAGAVAAPTPRLTRAKLPELALRKFDGNLMAWMTIWDSFESTVHNNPELSEVDKFTYLKSSLEKAAKEAIAGLSLTAANYTEAIDVLKGRFGNPDLIISKHMDALTSLPFVSSDSDLQGLRQLYDKVESHIRGLKGLSVSADSYCSLLSPVLIKKLTPELRLMLSRNVPPDGWKIDTLMTSLRGEIEARERAVVPSKMVVRQRNGTPTAIMFSGGKSSECCYCSQDGHSSTNCPVVVSVEARKQTLRNEGRCYNCTRKGHMGRECKVTSKCTKCQGRHHTSICTKGTQSAAPVAKPSSKGGLNPKAEPFGGPEAASLYVESGQMILLQTAKAVVYNPENPSIQTDARVILDSGSQRSYISSRLKKRLSLRERDKKPLSIVTFGSNDGKQQNCSVVQVGMRAKDGPDLYLQLLTVPLICGPLSVTPSQYCKTQFPHLRQLDLADEEEQGGEPDILVGSDQYWEIISGETRRGEHGPVAMYTKLGWVLSGPLTGIDDDLSQTSLVTHVLRGDTEPQAKRLDKQLQAFWDLESIGTVDSEDTVYDQFKDNVVFNKGRYEVSLPWKDNCPSISVNYNLSRRRLLALLRRLKNDPELFASYDAIIQEQLRKGIVQVVDKDKAIEGDRIHYLPHHPVVRKDKDTTKVRVVYDASAKEDGPSLNECLYTGPKFKQKILDILVRFRLHAVVVTADIEKAFLMIVVTERDRDVLRFLWVRNIHDNPPVVQTFKFNRVVFGVSCSPFLLNATLQTHLESMQAQNPPLISNLAQSLYVDDLISGGSTDTEAYELYTGAKMILKEGGFNLRKFITNSRELQNRVDQEERCQSFCGTTESYAQTTLGTSQKPNQGEHKVLGVLWDPDNDHLIVSLVDVAVVAETVLPTKRSVVSTVGKIYDPLGVLAPVTINFKIFFQELCQAGLTWDEPLQGTLLEKWTKLISSLKGPPIHLHRCYHQRNTEPITSHQLIGFCDASTAAYAAVVYLVMNTPTTRKASLVVAKTRVAPTHTQTVPRLELLAAFLLAKLITNVAHMLESLVSLQPSLCYTDSQIVFHWIHGRDKTWKPFVQNRVREIRQLQPEDNWRHCPGVNNPADVPSRGMTLRELSSWKEWVDGPSWLVDSKPGRVTELSPMPQDCLIELSTRRQQTLLVSECHGISGIIDITRFSSLAKLLRTSALVIMFVRKLKGIQFIFEELLSEVEAMWVRDVQLVLSLSKQFPNWKLQLNLYQENNVWRCRGRLANANVPYDTKFPALLPRDHHFTKLIVLRAHQRVLHNGVKETLAEVRTRYWIIRGRSLIKFIIHQCVVCRRLEGLHYKAPLPPPLPPFRVQEAPAFTFIGVDYAGPLHVRLSVSRPCTQKVWICLYTCCVSRAVHLDLVLDLSAQSFIRCFKRFTARRGIPRKVVSDNGTTFKAGSKVIETYFSEIGIQWCFNVPRAPWWGGVFERMIRSTKRCLKKMIGHAKLTYEELLTLIVEIESIINSRPLSYLSPIDIEQPLTPSHLLVGRRLLSIPDFRVSEDEYDPIVTTELLTKRVKSLNEILKHFWKRWRNEYLLELRNSHRQVKKRHGTEIIQVGDIVTVHSDDTPRNFWRLGRVEEIIVGRDGEGRVAIVKVLSKEGHVSMLRRSVQNLYPLEICEGTTREPLEDNLSPQETTTSRSDSNDDSTNESTRNVNEVPNVVPPIRRQSGRIASQEARDRIVGQLLED